MATVVTEGLLRDLAAFRATSGCAISIYVDFDPSDTPTIPAEKTKFQARVDEARKKAEAVAQSRGRECRLALAADFERIRDWGEEEFDRDGARALALFASSADGLFRIVPLVEPVADGCEIGPELWIAPLAGQIARGEGALVAVVSRERGVLYRLHEGRLEEIADESEEVPGQHDQGGWSQSRYRRHIDELAKSHLKTVAGVLERELRRLHFPGLVVVCPEELKSEFSDVLAADARRAIVGWTTAEAHASPSELYEVAQPVLEEWHRKRESELVERWKDEAGRDGRAASGWEETLESASDGRVECLVFQEGVEHSACQCPACGRVSVNGGRCPLDGTEMEQRDEGLDLAVHQVLAHGGQVLALRDQPDLEPVGGIAALLRY
jgi:peptide chain release factor subunit 1